MMAFEPDYLQDPETWFNVLREHQATIAAQVSRIEELEGLLSDCADDLETDANNRWRHNGEVHPANQLRYEADMQLVYRVRNALNKETG